MIGIVTARPAIAVAVARQLDDSLRASAGPFHAWHGAIDGEDALLLLAPEDGGTEGVWAAVKLLARRGADSVMQIHAALAAPSALRAHEWSPGAMIAPHAIADGRAIDPLLAATPDGARALPFPIDDCAIGSPHRNGSADATERGTNALTLARDLRSPWLADELAATRGFALFDRWSAGGCDAAAEQSLPLATLLLIEGAVRTAAETATPPTLRDLAIEEALAGLRG